MRIAVVGRRAMGIHLRRGTRATGGDESRSSTSQEPLVEKVNADGVTIVTRRRSHHDADPRRRADP